MIGALNRCREADIKTNFGDITRRYAAFRVLVATSGCSIAKQALSGLLAQSVRHTTGRPLLSSAPSPCRKTGTPGW